MPVLSGAFRLGRDAEVRYLPDSTAVTNLSLAYNFGKKNPSDNKRPTQWVDATLWGERGPKLQEWLLKGATVDVVLEDVHIETYSGGDGTPKFKLAARVLKLDLLSGAGDSQQSRPAPAPSTAPRQATPPKPRPATGFDDMDDDIPF